MNYQSTRNHRLQASSAAAVLEGIAADGGLYIRDDLSTMNFDWEGLLGEDSLTMSARILSALLPDIPDMETLVKQGYEGKFETDELMPLAQVGDRYVLELFRGPTSAFKDVALSLLPRLITSAKTVCGVDDEIVILTATSGDTGKAALEGFHDVPGTRIIVFYPHGGVSTVQQAQMATQEGSNVCVCAVRGNFDDAQTGVKNIFAACQDKDLHGVRLSSANSINIGRLAPQVMYYFRAYADLVKAGRIRVGDTVELVRFGTRASVLAINKDGSYLLQAGIMKVTAQPDEVYLIEETKQQAKKIIERSQRAFRSAGASTELDLRGMSADEAIATLDIFLDNAMMANLASVRIIHGKGTGVLRKAVQDELKRNRCVKRYRLGVYGEGEDGVTIAELA